MQMPVTHGDFRRSGWDADANGQQGVALCRFSLRQDAGDHCGRWGDRSEIKRILDDWERRVVSAYKNGFPNMGSASE